jgi:hypothetical protein
VILARVDINVPKRLCLLPNRHHRHIIRALFPLLFSTAGRSGIAEMLRINRVDRRLIRGAKNRYDAEVTLFLVDERICSMICWNGSAALASGGTICLPTPAAMSVFIRVAA